MERIAIMGGTFDPIHIGHMLAARYVYESGHFSGVWIMPSGQPPHKDNDITDSHHRFKMCCLAANDMEGIDVSDFELKREGVIYSIDTFSLLNEIYSNKAFYLIIGADSLFTLHRWHRFEALMKIGKFVVVDRGGYDPNKVDDLIKRYYNLYGTEFVKVNMPSIEIASSDIRKRIDSGLPVRYMLPDQVIKYLNAYNLYHR